MGYIEDLRKLIGHKRIVLNGSLVIIENKDGKIIVYNRSNRKNYPVPYDNLEDFCDKTHFIVGYFK